MKKVEFELISDAHIYLFFEKGMRGVVSYISKRYSKANNKYLIVLSTYDTKQKSKHNMHIHTNNLYGCAMSKFLPTSGFKWLDSKDFNSNK